ncbi:hypothetical protein Plhal304r1_c083g0167531 [Plasmopara halstedii]
MLGVSLRIKIKADKACFLLEHQEIILLGGKFCFRELNTRLNMLKLYVLSRESSGGDDDRNLARVQTKVRASLRSARLLDTARRAPSLIGVDSGSCQDKKRQATVSVDCAAGAIGADIISQSPRAMSLQLVLQQDAI